VERSVPNAVSINNANVYVGYLIYRGERAHPKIFPVSEKNAGSLNLILAYERGICEYPN